MQADLRMYLQDISDALAELEEYTSGKNKEEYLAERQLRRSVERVFEIIGEAMSKMSIDFRRARFESTTHDELRTSVTSLRTSTGM